jgi:hypothetical protein
MRISAHECPPESNWLADRSLKVKKKHVSTNCFLSAASMQAKPFKTPMKRRPSFVDISVFLSKNVESILI